jgi:hypothetical protein
VESLVEAVQRLADCIYEVNQLLTKINSKIDELLAEERKIFPDI